MRCSLMVRALNFDFNNKGSNPFISIMLQSNNISLIKLLIGFRTGLTSILINIFKNSFYQINLLNGFILQVELSVKYLYPFLLFCKKHSLFLFNVLVDIVCYEFLGNKLRYTLIYTLLNVQYAGRLFVKTKTHDTDFSLLSITSIFYTASWSEREVFDFFGLYFFFNKDLRRILLDYGFQGYPLRKDFPLSGFIEVYYDDTIKKITYDKVTLAQEYRIFFYPKNLMQ